MKAALTMTATDLARALRRLAEARVAERVSATRGDGGDGGGGSLETPVGPGHDNGRRKRRVAGPVRMARENRP